MDRRIVISGAGPRPTRPGGPESGFIPESKRAQAPHSNAGELRSLGGRIAVEPNTEVISPDGHLPAGDDHSTLDGSGVPQQVPVNEDV